MKLLSINSFLLFLQAPSLLAAASPQLPPPTGPHKTLGTKVIPLTDITRNETLSPTPSQHAREILISLYYPASSPASHHSTPSYTPYLPTLTQKVLESSLSLPPGTLSKITTNSIANASLKPDLGTLKTIIFSPGMGEPRFLYTALLEDLASHGFFVVSVDHPYDAEVVEFPDGKVVYSNVPDNLTVPDGVVPFYDVRVEDLVFVAKEMERIIGRSSLQARGTEVACDGLGVFGHSLGGAAAAEAIYASDDDGKFRAGANMDGMMFGEPISNTSFLHTKPPMHNEFLLLSADTHTTANDTTWQEFVASQRESDSWVKEFHCESCRHGTYTDQPALVEILGLEEKGIFPPGYLEENLGTIGGLRAEALQRAYVGAFFGWTLRGEREGRRLMGGDSKRWPEMVSAEL